jgi:hypothetical protein
VTVAFALCFTAWSLIAPTFKAVLGLNYTEALLRSRHPSARRAGATS